MKKLIREFFTAECGAALVEYAVALIIVSIVGSVVVLGIGTTSDSLATGACNTTASAVTGINTANGTSLATGTC